MKGLLLKDLLVVKLQWKFYALLLCFYIVMAFTSDASYFFPVMAMVLLILPLSSFSSDELARWDRFAAVLPGGRRAVVDAKYQFLLIVIAGMIVLFFVTDIVSYLIHREGSLWEALLDSVLYGAIGFLLNCVLYPVLFKFGTQKSRIVMGVVFGGVFAIIGMGMVIFQMGGGFPALTLSLPPAAVAAAAAVVLVGGLLVSYRLSCRIYERKEF